MDRSDVIEITECKRYTHKRAHTHAHTHSLTLLCSAIKCNAAKYKDINILSNMHKYNGSFINLLFRLSLLAALHTLNACIKMIIISIWMWFDDAILAIEFGSTIFQSTCSSIALIIVQPYNQHAHTHTQKCLEFIKYPKRHNNIGKIIDAQVHSIRMQWTIIPCELVVAITFCSESKFHSWQMPQYTRRSYYFSQCTFVSLNEMAMKSIGNIKKKHFSNSCISREFVDKIEISNQLYRNSDCLMKSAF